MKNKSVTSAKAAFLFGAAATLGAFTCTQATASTDVVIDGAYSIVFSLNPDGSPGGYQFDFGWNPADPQFSQNGTTLSIKPQTTTCDGDAADKDSVWGCDGSGPVAGYGKLYQQLLFFDTDEKGSVFEAETFFEACIDDSGLDAGYSVEGFVKVLSQDFSATFYEAYSSNPDYQTAPGCFAIPYTIVGDAIVQLQRGIIINGPNGLSGVDYGTAMGYLGATELPGGGGANPGSGGGSNPGSSNPNAVPTLPTLGLMLLAVMAGLMGRRQLRQQ